jgi:hypothetical protein
MSILFENSVMWRWLVRRTKESKPFFLAFATICGIVPVVIGYAMMQITNTHNLELKTHLCQNPAMKPSCVYSFLSVFLSFFLFFFALAFVI